MPSFTRLLALTSALLFPLSAACKQQQTDGQVKKVQQETFELTLFDNSDTLSQATVLNEKGHVIGSREVTNEAGTIYSQQYYFSDGEETIDMPLLEGFTNTSVSGLSETDLVVGYASRPVGHPDGSLTAIVWDRKTQELTNLGFALGDNASSAHDISADGKRITGYSVGSAPAKMRPCVWDWNAETKGWDCTVLNTPDPYSPYLQSSMVRISPDGKRIAACPTEVIEDNGTINSSLFIWELQGDEWKERKVCDEQFRVRDINAQGTTVGDIADNGLRKPICVTLDGTVKRLGLLPEDTSGIAHGINDSGIIVGHSDDPPGPEGGPQAVMWREDKVVLIRFPKETMFSSAFGITNSGKICGLADITFPDEDGSKDGDAETEPLVKTLGFVRLEAASGSVSKE